MTKILSLILFFILLSPLQAQKVFDPLGNQPWELLGSEDGVLLKRKTVKGSELFAVRGEILIKSPIEKVAAVICDFNRWIEWTKDMSSVKDLGITKENAKIVYQSFDMPAFIDNREVIYGFKLTPLKHGFLVIGKGEKGLPEFHRENHTRMELILGRWKLMPSKQNYTTVELDVLMDPKGSLPSWFVNIVQRSYPADTLNALARQTKKPDIVALKNPIKSCNF